MAERRRSISLRVRITLVATAVVAAALVVGAVLFASVLRISLLDGATASAETYASSLAAALDSGAALDGDVDDRFFQVQNDDGQVTAASEDAERLGAIAEDDYDRNNTVTVEGDAYLLVGEDYDDGVVVVGQNVDDVTETLGTVTTLLVAAVPVVALLVALTTWIVVGRALRPVERMRREVDDVSASRLDRRLAEPGSADEIGRLAVTLNSMLDRLDESQSAQKRFISDASHELRSPLASLRQFAEVAQAHPDRVTAGELSDAILDEGARLERLVDGMLTLARSDEHGLVVVPRAVDLDDLVLAEAKRLRASTTLTVDASGVGPARISGDAPLLAGLVRNLVDNAARHAHTTVGISLTETADGIVLTVDDDGDGIPADQRERVFDRFVRLDDARGRESGGSGLGLSIVREIAVAHGGRVAASQSPLGGARVEVRIPV
ncbi:signal transduction histidine kinase [Conyzicola lurida]|uniref:histidine kinase n=1 Tax=Conyzicola lurida TaxID=1172621 RepID=A0A841AL04_9MICO|nr:signal transduction histidine kinase [Conyzicola lurida]